MKIRIQEKMFTENICSRYLIARIVERVANERENSGKYRYTDHSHEKMYLLVKFFLEYSFMSPVIWNAFHKETYWELRKGKSQLDISDTLKIKRHYLLCLKRRRRSYIIKTRKTYMCIRIWVAITGVNVALMPQSHFSIIEHI